VKDMGLIVKYSSEQRFISFSENVSDRGNAISTVSVAFARLRKASIRARSCAEVRPDHADEQ